MYRLVIAIVLSLTWVGPVWAAEPREIEPLSCTNSAPNRLECALPDLPPMSHEQRCLYTMEAAMKRWDPFVNYGLLPGKDEDMPERVKAIAQWNETRDQCWSKP